MWWRAVAASFGLLNSICARSLCDHCRADMETSILQNLCLSWISFPLCVSGLLARVTLGASHGCSRRRSWWSSRVPFVDELPSNVHEDIPIVTGIIFVFEPRKRMGWGEVMEKHTHTYIHICTHTHTHIHTYMYTHTHTYTHICTHTHIQRERERDTHSACACVCEEKETAHQTRFVRELGPRLKY